jgi:hypothetical protein
MREDSTSTQCLSCSGSGEIPSDYGSLDCPDCGGAGILPSKNVLTDWRMRDIERAHAAPSDPTSSEVRWLVAELRNSRQALNEIIALAHDIEDSNVIGQRIRFAANRALGLYPVRANEAKLDTLDSSSVG